MIKKVSIIMGIYNCEDTLAAALQSVIAQTYQHWQLILCDDGSKDGTFQIAQAYAERDPERIVLLQNPRNMGLNYTLNRCLKSADGEYIARQDADDMSMPLRLEQEVQILEQFPQYSIVSTAMTLFDDLGEWGMIRRKETPQPEDLIQGTPFAHAPSVIRADALRSVGGYSVSPRLLRVEDYHLWYKLYLKGYRGYNISDALYQCRDDRRAQSRRKFRYRLNECYVKWLVFRGFGLHPKYLPQVIKPLLVGLLPKRIYHKLHRGRLSHEAQNP